MTKADATDGPGDDRAAAMLAAGATVRAAADAVGVSERTIYRWLEGSEFRTRVREIRDGLISAASGRLIDGMSESAEKLRKLLEADSEAVQLAAAKAGIELPLRVVELTELQDKVNDLSTRLDALAKGS